MLGQAGTPGPQDACPHPGRCSWDEAFGCTERDWTFYGHAHPSEGDSGINSDTNSDLVLEAASAAEQLLAPSFCPVFKRGS